MKIFNKIKKSAALLLFSGNILCGTVFAETAGLGQVAVVDGTVISAWIGIDSSSGYQTIEAAVGPISSDPSTWTYATFTSSTEYATSQPFLTTNANGDALVVYEFYDTVNDHNLVAAAMLPTGTTTWTVNTISNSADSASQGDQKGHIDALGNVVATWGSYNASAAEDQVALATSSFTNLPITWSSPVQLSQ